MANALTGKFDVVAEFGIQAVNRILAAQHQDETYLHSIPADVLAEGLPWVRIDDTDTGVRGIAQIQVSTPTVTLPAGDHASRVTIHYQLMAHIQADSESAAVPEFVHGEIQVTVNVVQEHGEGEDVIEVDLGAEDLEVTFTPDMGAPLSEEEKAQVNQIIRNVLMTGFEPVSSDVYLPGRGEELRVQHWRFKTMPDDERPAVALLLNLTDKKPEADHPATVTEVFLDEEDDFAIAIGRDLLVSTLLDLMRDTLPRSIEGNECLGVEVLGWCVGIGVKYTAKLNLDSVDIELRDEPDEGRARLTVPFEVTAQEVITKRKVNGKITVTQDFRLNADRGSINLIASGGPNVDLIQLGLPVFDEWIADKLEEKVRAARDRILKDAGPLVQGLPAGFRDILPGLRIPDPDVGYTAAEIQAEGVIVRGTLDFGPWQDVVATFETKTTQQPRLLASVGLILQNDLEWGVLSPEFRAILEDLEQVHGFSLSDQPVITTEEEGSRWRIDDQGKTLIVIREVEALNIYDPVHIDTIYELNAFNSWIPGGTIQLFQWVSDGRDAIASEEHKFITRISEERLRGILGQLCLEVSGMQGSPEKEVAGTSCGIAVPVAPRPLEDIGGGIGAPVGPGPVRGHSGGLVVDVPDSGGAVRAHTDSWRPAVWSAMSRPGGSRSRRGGGANLLVQFFGSESAKTWSVLRDALAGRSQKDAAIFVVAVVPPGLVIEPLKTEANIAWARTEDAEGAWAKAFSVAATPATFLVNPQGRTVWQQAGRLDAATFIAALDEHLVAGGPLRWQQLRLKVRVGQPAPDFIFEYLQGRQIALRRLRRRPVLLNFWKSWSAPCLAELRHLQKLHDRFAREGWVILAINDEEDPQRAQEVFEENGFTFTSVADADRQITELYGVNCWPTTVSLNEKKIVRHIQFGVTKRRGLHVSKVATP